MTLSQLFYSSLGDLDASLVLFGTQFPHLSHKWFGLDQEPQTAPLGWVASEWSKEDFKVQIPGPTLWKICLSRWGGAWGSEFQMFPQEMLMPSQAWEPSAWSLSSLQFPGLLFQVGTCCLSLCGALPLGPPCTPAGAGWLQQGIRSCWVGGEMTFQVIQQPCQVPWDNHKLHGNCSHFYWEQGTS